jgi:hypothetical protein
LKTAIATAAISARPSIHVPSAAAIESSAAASAALMTLLSHCLAHLKEIEDRAAGQTIGQCQSNLLARPQSDLKLGFIRYRNPPAQGLLIQRRGKTEKLR